jgi:hypothetical protein
MIEPTTEQVKNMVSVMERWYTTKLYSRWIENINGERIYLAVFEPYPGPIPYGKLRELYT